MKMLAGEGEMVKKQHVSVRLAEADHRKMKDIAKRLGVKESDLFRYIIKHSLNKLLPFQDEQIRGTDLIPALLECGQDLARYFDLDTEQLDQIVNGGLDEDARKIEKEDLDILAMAGSSDHYALVKLAAISSQPLQEDDLVLALKHYLNHKYRNTRQLISKWSRDSLVKTQSVLVKTNTKSKEKQYA